MSFKIKWNYFIDLWNWKYLKCKSSFSLLNDIAPQWSPNFNRACKCCRMCTFTQNVTRNIRKETLTTYEIMKPDMSLIEKEKKWVRNPEKCPKKGSTIVIKVIIYKTPVSIFNHSEPRRQNKIVKIGHCWINLVHTWTLLLSETWNMQGLSRGCENVA